MSWPQQRARIEIHYLFENAHDQGKWIASGEVGDYKSALTNGMEAFVRDLHPPAGSYVLFAPNQPYPPQGKGETVRFEVNYPSAVIKTSGRQTIVGCDFPWSSYMINSDPEWIEAGDGLVIPNEEAS